MKTRRLFLGLALIGLLAGLLSSSAVAGQAQGPEDAVRETIEMILKAQRRWDDLIQKYTT